MRSKYPSKSFSFHYPQSQPHFTLVRFHLSSLHGLLNLVYDGLGRVGGFVFELLGGLKGRALLAALPQEDTGDLDNTNAPEEEVDGGKAGRLTS